MDEKVSSENQDKRNQRRNFLSTALMGLGLAASYGTLATMAGRFLYPAKPTPKQWAFVAVARSIPVGSSLSYQTPKGEKVAITRHRDKGLVDDFIALSSTCPHLGCQVHWESQNSRFFCPCHNGTFDQFGKGTGGPPKDSQMSLPQYPLKIEKGMLFIEVAASLSWIKTNKKPSSVSFDDARRV